MKLFIEGGRQSVERMFTAHTRKVTEIYTKRHNWKLPLLPIFFESGESEDREREDRESEDRESEDRDRERERIGRGRGKATNVKCKSYTISLQELQRRKRCTSQTGQKKSIYLEGETQTGFLCLT